LSVLHYKVTRPWK